MIRAPAARSLPAVILATALSAAAEPPAAPPPSPCTLRVHPSNPRYLTVDGERAIYLAGHQWFNDLQHHAWNTSVDVDWDRYLQFLRARGINYLRSWIVWSAGVPSPDDPSPRMPYLRTGPGSALDGRPRFDLTRFDESFFARMRSQVRAAGERGVYVSIMLFEVYGFMDRDGSYQKSLWAGNMLHGPNNVNGIDTDENGDRHGLEFFASRDPRVQELQRSWVRKVIDTVGDLDNVFFEVANELACHRWQREIVRLIRRFEAGRPRQHLVYMSPGGRDRLGRWTLLPRNALLETPADVYSVTRGWNPRYRRDPPVEDAGRPVIMDMDHVAVQRDGDNEWNNGPTTPWKLLTRGYHQCIYDHDHWKPGANRSRWDTTRRNVGMTARYASRMDLARMRPRSSLSSTRYCLAAPGREYLIFCPGEGEIVVSGLLAGRGYRREWYDPATGRASEPGTVVPERATWSFTPPVRDAVLYLVIGSAAAEAPPVRPPAPSARDTS